MAAFGLTNMLPNIICVITEIKDWARPRQDHSSQDSLLHRIFERREGVVERGKVGKRKDPPFLTPAGRWFLSWPIFISLGLHGLMVCFLLTWGYPRPAENLPRVVMVQIVEGKRKKIRLPPASPQPKPKNVPKRERPIPKPPTVVFPKEADAPPPFPLRLPNRRCPKSPDH